MSATHAQPDTDAGLLRRCKIQASGGPRNSHGLSLPSVSNAESKVYWLFPGIQDNPHSIAFTPITRKMAIAHTIPGVAAKPALLALYFLLQASWSFWSTFLHGFSLAATLFLHASLDWSLKVSTLQSSAVVMAGLARTTVQRSRTADRIIRIFIFVDRWVGCCR